MLKSRSRIEAKVWNALKGQNQIMSQICAVCESDNKIHQCIFKAHLRRSSLSICLSFVSYLPLLTSNHNNRNPLLKVVPLQMLSDSSGRREGLSVHVCVCARAWTQSLCHRLIGVCETDRQRRAGGKKGESSHNLICVYGSLSISRSLSEKLDGTDAISSQHNRAFVSPLTRARACVVHWPATIAACMESSTLSKPPCWLKRRRLWMFFCLGKQTVYKVCRQDACSKPGWFWS